MKIITIMGNNNNPFGWGAVFHLYGWKDWGYDSIFPVFMALLLTYISMLSDVDSYVLLGKVLDIGISIIPVMLSLLVAAYAIILSMFSSNAGDVISETDKGKELLAGVNSDFAISILSSIVGVLLCVVIKLFHSFKFELEYAAIVNSIVLFIVLYLMFFSIWILKDLVIGIFDVGVVAIHLRK